ERHQEGAAVFSQAGTYAPTLGVLGAVIGLIAALGDMSDIEALGYAISAAFIATLFGIFTGYVLWHPFANKLKEKSKQEILRKQIMIEGILSLTTGDSPQVIKDKLSSYLSRKNWRRWNRRGSMRRKKQRKESKIDESWLLPYADLLTLLVALFIVLFAMSEIDTQKYKELSQVFKNEFSGGEGILEYKDSPVKHEEGLI